MSRLVRIAPFLPLLLVLLLGSGLYGPDQPAPLVETATPTPTATSTRLPSYLPIVLRDYAVTPSPTLTPRYTLSPFQFTLQNGNPAYLKNFANTAGCNWLGIAGQVFDLNGNVIVNLLVHLEGGGLNVDAVTGSRIEYGPGGYELFLGSTPINTTDVYHIQLRSSQGQPLSDVYVIPTFADCNKNLILANFVQNH
jgi:hypothetical protein